ncbi:hypothetical protein [Tsuneonella amylolytica]|uniref:hypothetical protein n=1 Tax=Tsuneonella amylolytica TaxID=2338327 RepID=UPI001F48F363|nr:hypothetical protein [Tsuneonella amylolytica]
MPFAVIFAPETVSRRFQTEGAPVPIGETIDLGCDLRDLLGEKTQRFAIGLVQITHPVVGAHRHQQTERNEPFAARWGDEDLWMAIVDAGEDIVERIRPDGGKDTARLRSQTRIEVEKACTIQSVQLFEVQQHVIVQRVARAMEQIGQPALRNRIEPGELRIVRQFAPDDGVVGEDRDGRGLRSMGTSR